MKLTKISQFVTELSEWHIYEILVVDAPKICVLLERLIISANYIADIVANAIFDNHFGNLGNVVVDTIIPFIKNPLLLFRLSLFAEVLFILN